MNEQGLNHFEAESRKAKPERHGSENLEPHEIRGRECFRALEKIRIERKHTLKKVKDPLKKGDLGSFEFNAVFFYDFQENGISQEDADVLMDFLLNIADELDQQRKGILPESYETGQHDFFLFMHEDDLLETKNGANLLREAEGRVFGRLCQFLKKTH
ncbi:MAG TPA: hypothetical protein VJA22_00185 [Patescibacteria group bacterium]|nr:hypothetical protein [Patescibacteria group bacterium]